MIFSFLSKLTPCVILKFRKSEQKLGKKHELLQILSTKPGGGSKCPPPTLVWIGPEDEMKSIIFTQLHNTWYNCLFTETAEYLTFFSLVLNPSICIISLSINLRNHKTSHLHNVTKRHHNDGISYPWVTQIWLNSCTYFSIHPYDSIYRG